MRKANSVLQTGKYVALDNSNPKVFSWRRIDDKGGLACLFVNLSAESQEATVDGADLQRSRKIFGNATGESQNKKFVVSVPPDGSGIWLKTSHTSK